MKFKVIHTQIVKTVRDVEQLPTRFAIIYAADHGADCVKAESNSAEVAEDIARWCSNNSHTLYYVVDLATKETIAKYIAGQRIN